MKHLSSSAFITVSRFREYLAKRAKPGEAITKRLAEMEWIRLTVSDALAHAGEVRTEEQEAEHKLAEVIKIIDKYKLPIKY